MDISSDYTLADCAKYKAERDALVQRMEEIASEIDRTLSGVEGIEDAPAMRWARGLREALGALHSPRTSYEDIEAARWVREQGGLDSVKKLLDWVVGHCSTKQQLDFDFWLSGRVMYELGFDEDMAARDEVERRLLARLMPPGMEWLLDVWPKWSNGEYCKFGDWWKAEMYGKFEPQQFSKLSIYTPEQLREWGQDNGDNYGYEWDFMRPSDPKYRPDKAEPPAPKVLDADGVEIREGDTVWRVDTGVEYWVKRGQTITADAVVIIRKTDCDCESEIVKASQLIHDQPDSWERWREECRWLPVKYCKLILGVEYDHYTQLNEAFDAQGEDLVRRAKTLAGVGK